MKIGFLFNHEAAHQVAHSLPIALALSRMRPDFDVEIFYAAGPGEDEIRRLAAGSAHRCTFTPLSIRSRAARIAAALAGDNLPLARIALLRDNVDRFSSLAALVVPEKTSLLLKTRFGLPHLKMIHTRHGAGDRAIGFDKASRAFDFVLVSGTKVRDRLMEAGLIRAEDHAVVGYPKFDTLADRPPPPRLFANDRPTVLYNPHPSPHVSSWFRMGRNILEHFYASRNYNLIFAPHVMLFRKRWSAAIDRLSLARVGKIDDKFRRADNMLIDTGSRASIDMSHVLAADIYLGDVSSQIYEFMWFPRPCIFVDAHGVDWKDNPDFAHWHAGAVISDPGQLENALATAAADFECYRGAQEAMFARTFDLDRRPSSERAATAIADWLAKGNSSVAYSRLDNPRKKTPPRGRDTADRIWNDRVMQQQDLPANRASSYRRPAWSNRKPNI